MITQPVREPSYKQVLPRRLLEALAVVLLTCLIVGSFLPASLKRDLGTAPYRSSVGVAPQHRFYHLAVVGITALVLLLLAEDRRGEVKASAALFLLCCGIETVQLLIHYSVVFEWWDVRDDFFAILGAFLVIQLANRLSASQSL